MYNGYGTCLHSSLQGVKVLGNSLGYKRIRVFRELGHLAFYI